MNPIKVIIGLVLVLGVLVAYGANGLLVDDGTGPSSDGPAVVNRTSQDENSLNAFMSGEEPGSKRRRTVPTADTEDKDEYDFFEVVANLLGLGSGKAGEE